MDYLSKRERPAALSEREKTIMRAIIDAVESRGIPPSVRDICAATGLRSSSTVHKYLNRLAEAGYIFRDTTASRGISILRDENGADYSYLRNEEEEDAFEEMLNLPVVGNVAAGEPIFADENIEDKIAYPARFVRRDGAFMLRIRGESMIGVGINDGDYIVVEPEQVAALLQNEPSDRTGIGVKNVNDRLRIYFGAAYGISIVSAPYEGTTVTIRTPRVPEDREGDYDKLR